ncbi:MAG: hypothetical protein GEU79_15460 [Acidimicrobiia bacterium]|nr:hypothetical protein [Acidimicrobiia bacterium]
MGLICGILQILQLVILAWVVLSWIPVSSDHPVGRAQIAIDRLVAPVIGPIRKVIPPLRLGGGYLDLSPLVLILGIALISRIIC